ncbi:hypothetical protein X975_14462, partial [Stegodyphus mimosarum]
MKELSNGFHHDGREYILLLNGTIICDIPAKSFIKCTVGHNGYHSCDKCEQKGIWLRRITFLARDSILRTNKSFRERSDKDHHNPYKFSPFLELPIDMVKQFPADYMHMVCLGVMRKLLLKWIRHKGKGRLTNSSCMHLSGLISSQKQHIPSDFNRKPRTLSDIDR